MLCVGIVIAAFLRCAITDTERRLGKRFDRLESKVAGLATDRGRLAQEVTKTRERLTRLEGFTRGYSPADVPAAE